MFGEQTETDLYVLRYWLENRNIEVEMREHPLAKNFRKLEDTGISFEHIKSILSPHQLIVTGPHGTISVIRGGASLGDYEIFSIEGGLFEDIRRYPTVKEAGEAIFELVTTGRDDGEEQEDYLDDIELEGDPNGKET